MRTHADVLLEYIFSVDAGKTGYCAVNADQSDALESDMKYTGGVGGGCIEIRYSIQRKTSVVKRVQRSRNVPNEHMILVLSEPLGRT